MATGYTQLAWSSTSNRLRDVAAGNVVYAGPFMGLLGNLLPGTEQLVEMDRLGLLDGEVHQVHFFFANRQASGSRFNVRTNIAFWSDAAGLVASGPFD